MGTHLPDQPPDFYIASNEVNPDDDFARPRKCWRLRNLPGDELSDTWLVRIDPPVPGREFGPGEPDVDKLVISPKLPGVSLTIIDKWPVHINVGRLRVDASERQARVLARDFQPLTVAELYKTEEDAHKKLR